MFATRNIGKLQPIGQQHQRQDKGMKSSAVVSNDQPDQSSGVIVAQLDKHKDQAMN